MSRMYRTGGHSRKVNYDSIEECSPDTSPSNNEFSPKATKRPRRSLRNIRGTSPKSGITSPQTPDTRYRRGSETSERLQKNNQPAIVIPSTVSEEEEKGRNDSVLRLANIITLALRLEEIGELQKVLEDAKGRAATAESKVFEAILAENNVKVAQDAVKSCIQEHFSNHRTGGIMRPYRRSVKGAQDVVKVSIEKREEAEEQAAALGLCDYIVQLYNIFKKGGPKIEQLNSILENAIHNA
ncbi:hypothetical protein FOXG_22521 [Fusarium oxysporum f. sp. lycopersici 4287]|uniref:Uncharacterized protein n=1 Tax=Fusarium oxysporum f. sp. lycopersici (strain 4287 / CBS 123668 / FGSC 9935 / NRRL 34936) TaxID=426428 RepID=A0A0J9W9Y7_FUSO4|nr:hypothetical protein FOXG_22521 [Fusarium oxysporum f. sp. lycopersici 4287]EWZ77977.1 hypothetical protein FOWG_17680 [Fusarium oxysporum f. sp. lycopersici MN25]KNB19311.1 hypothetical protein FOXG_22521 [Fusarium oxysporum f. sp. lycopersici 4287]